MAATRNHNVPPPTSRKLRIFAFDPAVSADTLLADVSEVTVEVVWEDSLQPGPVGDYLEVVDRDPASGAWYAPVDLDQRYILAQHGLAPSESNPQFHQQMVYAVAMTTIGHFEEALGRVALWSSYRPPHTRGRGETQYARRQFVRRLRIYPHALRDANAYYSPQKKALLFGYFTTRTSSPDTAAGTMVFTCLSHDIIAHETTHALLDGVHPRFSLPSNKDVLAFHEAFSDIVAIMQKFSYPGVLRGMIARARGDLSSGSMLGQLAQQFGRATGRGRALRDAIGYWDKAADRWIAHVPDPRRLATTHEPHERGAILVAAVFLAFLKVYRSRTADLYRIATDGTGVLRAGEIHPDLAGRLADEASRCARHVLRICIRAIDYCPPFDLTFGDYLRAIITGDVDLFPDDPDGYRRAFIEAFRQWGIYPARMGSLSVEALQWPDFEAALEVARVATDARMEKELAELFTQDRSIGSEADDSGPKSVSMVWSLESDRRQAWLDAADNQRVFWEWLHGDDMRWAELFGIVLEASAPATIVRSVRSNRPAVEVHSVRPARRRTTRGEVVRHLVVELTQRRRGYLDPDVQREKDGDGQTYFAPEDRGDFTFRAGCTIMIDPIRYKVLRVIRTAGRIDDDAALDRVRRYLNGEDVASIEPTNAFDNALAAAMSREPFALLHRGGHNHG